MWAAEDPARELPNLPLEDALRLVHLYAERGSPKYERAALRWLERYLAEGTPRLRQFAEIATSLAKPDLESDLVRLLACAGIDGRDPSTCRPRSLDTNAPSPSSAPTAARAKRSRPSSSASSSAACAPAAARAAWATDRCR